MADRIATAAVDVLGRPLPPVSAAARAAGGWECALEPQVTAAPTGAGAALAATATSAIPGVPAVLNSLHDLQERRRKAREVEFLVTRWRRLCDEAPGQVLYLVAPDRRVVEVLTAEAGELLELGAP